MTLLLELEQTASLVWHGVAIRCIRLHIKYLVTVMINAIVDEVNRKFFYNAYWLIYYILAAWCMQKFY